MSIRKRLLFFVALPTMLIGFYYLVLASDMYVSESRFSVRGPEGGGNTEWQALFGQNISSTSADAYVVQDYVLSADLLQLLDKRLQLRSHFQNRNADIISRLASDATAEEFLDHYGDVVTVSFDPLTTILTVRARAYTPEMAQQLGQAILEESELLVNRMRERALQDSLAIARSELTIAEQRVVTTREALKQLRRRTDVIDPQAATGAVLNLVAGLEVEAAKARAQLAETRAYMREDNAQVAALKSRITALEGQIVAEKARLTGSSNQVMNEISGDFERLSLEREFAEKQYVSTLASLEAARIRAASKSRYLMAFAIPSLPEEATYPRRFTITGLAAVAFLLIYGIGSLVIAAVREHAGY